MQIVCISRGSYSRGTELAESLAGKLGYQCLGREELVEEANKNGIPVGKLEVAILKPHHFSERLDLLKEHFQALATMVLCERALSDSIVYHGHTGHLLLPGVGHVLRARVVADMEYRIKSVMGRLNLSREKAKEYIQKVEEDRSRWVRLYYNVEWDVSSLYDVTVNLEQMSIENAATALCAMAQLPDFQVTPVSRKALEDLLVSSRARVALARDERTKTVPIKVRSDKGVVTATYIPQHARVAQEIPEILKDVEGVKESICTVASTNILWIQEKYSHETDTFRQVLAIANKWEAGVELLQMTSAEGDEDDDLVEETVAGREALVGKGERGVTTADSEDVRNTIQELTRLGRTAGGRSVIGTRKDLYGAIDHSVQYSLVIIGDVFLSKGAAVRQRLTRELRGFLDDRIKSPVVLTEELKPRFLFGGKQLLNMLGFLGGVFLLYLLVFTHQKEVLEFLSAKGTTGSIMAAGALFIFVPLVAYLYGTATGLFLKWIKME